MAKEREIMILDVKRSQVIARLKRLGAKHVGDHRFRRMEFMLDGKIGAGHAWVRVRTDGTATTLTLKEMHKKGGFTPMSEYEVKTNDFRETLRIMSRLARKECIYFENSREAYSLWGAYITLDKWPGIPLYVEIEAPTDSRLRQVYKKLAIEGKFAGNAAIHDVYKRYGLDFEKVARANSGKLKELLAEA